MDKRLFFMMNRARSVLYRYADTGIEKAIGVPAAQVSVLFALEKAGNVPMQSLGRVLGLNNSAMTGLVQRMRDAGLVDRVQSPSDARAAHLIITALGHTKLQQAKPLLAKLNTQLAEGFSKDELDLVIRFLNTVVDRFSSHGEPS